MDPPSPFLSLSEILDADEHVAPLARRTSLRSNDRVDYAAIASGTSVVVDGSESDTTQDMLDALEFLA